MSWPLVKLGSVATVNPRIPKDTDESQLVTFLGMASVSESGELIAQETRVLSETKKGFTYFERNDVLLAKITPCFENGKAALVSNLERQIGFGSTEFHVLRAAPAELDPKYLFYLVWNNQFRFIGETAMKGAAGQKRISADFLKDFEIPLPPLPEQKRIAAILDKADAIRRKRQQAIKLADDFLRSVFLEMFGDPVTNPKGWKPATLGDLIFFAKDGPHVSPTYSEKGIPFLSTRHVKPSGVIWEDLKYVTQEEADVHWKKCKPERGDILYTKGGTTGIACPVDFEKDFAVWVHVALLRPNKSEVNYIWLAQMLNSKYCYDQSQKHTRGATNKDLGLKRMVEIEMFCPPITEQNKFVEIKNRVENLIKRSENLNQSQLFESLSQKAFSGKL